MSFPDTAPRVVAFAGGKGGTGKSLLAANVAIYMATLGKRVVLIDAALGSANLHTFLGGDRPQRSLAEVFGKTGATLEEVAEHTRVPGLRLVAGERDPAWVANPRGGQIKRLGEQIPALSADYVILDLGPGTSTNLVELFLLADVGVLVAIPEPTSVELCYRFIRASFLRCLHREGLSDVLKSGGEPRNYGGGMPAPIDVYEHALTHDAALAAKIEDLILSRSPHLIINMARSKADMDLGNAVAAAGRRRLGTPIHYLGYTEYDEAVWVSLRRKRPLLVEHPESRVAKCIERVTRRIIGREADRSIPNIEMFAGESHYDLLGVAPTASFEDIRRANRRIREIYGSESVVISGLFTYEKLDKLHKRLDEAYRTLMDATKRKAYDQELFPEGIPSQRILGEVAPQAIDAPPAERPPMPALTPDTEYTGMLLRKIREASGVDLRSIAEQSKIGMTYLRAIEAETFEKLPALVYVRGFVVEYAKILNLDVDRVMATFLERYRLGRANTEAG